MPLPGTLQGVVTDAATGNPVSGAVVALVRRRVDRQVRRDRRVGPLRHHRRAARYRTPRRSRRSTTTRSPRRTSPCRSTRRRPTNFALTQTPGTIQGTITGNAGPIAGATVTLSNGAIATADSTGQYLFASVTAGSVFGDREGGDVRERDDEQHLAAQRRIEDGRLHADAAARHAAGHGQERGRNRDLWRDGRHRRQVREDVVRPALIRFPTSRREPTP